MIRLAFLFSLCSILASAQKPVFNAPSRALPTPAQWQYVLENYNTLDDSILLFAEKDLEKTILAKSCFKFIYNNDHTKFMAFFIEGFRSPEYEITTRFGSSSRSYLGENVNYSGYTLYGMLYEGKWHFYDDMRYSFYEENDEKAKLTLLYSELVDMRYFKFKDKIWEGKGETPFQKARYKSVYSPEELGKPEIIANYNHRTGYIRQEARNEEFEAYICPVTDSIWQTLHTQNPLAYSQRYKANDHCLVLYNKTHTKALIPIIYYDSQKQPFLTYYVWMLENGKKRLYTSAAFPLKQISPGGGSETVVYDIRKYINNWNWGTRNLIDNDNFWDENFKPNILKPL